MALSLPVPHFKNYRNSCAVDTLLELAYFVLHPAIGVLKQKGELSHKLSAVCIERSNTSHSSSTNINNLRDTIWDWLIHNVQGYPERGGMACFMDILPHLCSSEEEWDLYSASLHISAVCRNCKTDQLVDRRWFPLLLSTREIHDSYSSLELALQAKLFRDFDTEPLLNSCNQCHARSLSVSESATVLPHILFVQLPQLNPRALPMLTAPEISSVDITDATSAVKTVHGESVYNGRVHVLEGVHIPEKLVFGPNEEYDLVASVRNQPGHFATMVKANGNFHFIDGCRSNIVSNNTFAGLCATLGNRNHEHEYKTNTDDDFFLFVYSKSVAGQHDQPFNNFQSADDQSANDPLYGHLSAGTNPGSKTSSLNCQPPDSNSSQFQEVPFTEQQQTKSHTADNVSKSPPADDRSSSVGMKSHSKPSLSAHKQAETDSQPIPCTGSPAKADPRSKTASLNCQPPDSNSSQSAEINSSSDSLADDGSETKMETEVKDISAGQGVWVDHSLNQPQVNEEPLHSNSSGKKFYKGVPPVQAKIASSKRKENKVIDNIFNITLSFPQNDETPFILLSDFYAFLETPEHLKRYRTLDNKLTGFGLDPKGEFYPYGESKRKYVSLRACLLCLLSFIAGKHKTDSHDQPSGVLRKRLMLLTELSEWYKLSSSKGSQPLVQLFGLEVIHDQSKLLVRLVDYFQYVSDRKDNRTTELKVFLLKSGFTSENDCFGHSDNSTTRLNITLQAFVMCLFKVKPKSDWQTKVTQDVLQDIQKLFLEKQKENIPKQRKRTATGSHPEVSQKQQKLSTPVATTKRLVRVGTEALLDKGVSHSPNTTDSLKTPYVRRVADRVKLQQAEFSRMAQQIHKGGKQALIAALTYDLAHPLTRNQQATDSQWNGKFEPADFLQILEHIPSRKDSSISVLEEYALAMISKKLHVNGEEIIQLTDNNNSNGVVDQLRKRLPGFFASNRKVQKHKKKMEQEFMAIMQPQVTGSGYRINPYRLQKCLKFRYPWEIKDTLFAVWGDARVIADKKTCVLAVRNVSNENMLHGVKFQSPDQMFPVCMYYGSDSRFDLEMNIGDQAGRPSWLNQWIEDVQAESTDENAVHVLLHGDSMFLDAIVGDAGELAPTSKTKCSIYYKGAIDKAKVDKTTGFRSGLDMPFDRDLPNSLLPAIPLHRTVFCIGHMLARCAEKLVTLRLKSIARMSVEILNNGKQHMNAALHNFKTNMIQRGVQKAARIEINNDGTLKDSHFTLNQKDALAILTPHTEYQKASVMLSPLLHGVSQTNVFFELDKVTLSKMDRSQGRITEYDLETAIWDHLYYSMDIMQKSDPLPRTDADGNKTWGLTNEKITELKSHLDLFHRLFSVRYGASELTPYMMKAIDVTVRLLDLLPVKTLARFDTGGGEHSHYVQACNYYQHSQRGGAYKTHDVIYHWFFVEYRKLHSQIAKFAKSQDPVEAKAGSDFLEWVRKEWLAVQGQKFIRGFLAYRRFKHKKDAAIKIQYRFRRIQKLRLKAAIKIQKRFRCYQHDQKRKLDNGNGTEKPETVSSESMLQQTRNSLVSPVMPSSTSVVVGSISAVSSTSKSAQNPRIFHSAPKRVVIFGNIPQRYKKNWKTKHELTEHLKSKGIRLMDISADRLDKVPDNMTFVVLAEQTKCNAGSPAKALLVACKRGMPIVSFQYAFDLIYGTIMQPLPSYYLDVSVLARNPEAQSKTSNYGKFRFNKGQGIKPLTTLKKLFRKKQTQENKERVKTPVRPRRPVPGYLVYFNGLKKQNFPSLKKPMLRVFHEHEQAKQDWASLSEDQKAVYILKGRENFDSPVADIGSDSE